MFAESPFYAVDTAIEKLFSNGLSLDALLEVVEVQHQKVSRWLDNLFGLQGSGLEELEELTTMGIEGNSMMLEALEWIYQSAEGEDFELELEEATALLQEGHQLVEESFALCDQIDQEVEDETFVVISKETF